MSKLRPMTYEEVVRRLKAAGFVFDRQAKGSHETVITRKRNGAQLCRTIQALFPQAL